MDINIDELCTSADLVIFSLTYCPFCTNAKRHAITLPLSFTLKVVEVDQHPLTNIIRKRLRSLTNISTLPLIFFRGRLIGDSATFVTKNLATLH